MVCDALQLPRNRADRFGTGGNAALRVERFKNAAVCPGGSGRGVARNGFHHMQSLFIRTAAQHFFDSAMLVAK